VQDLGADFVLDDPLKLPALLTVKAAGPTTTAH
jgi:hypothetical protein